MPPFDATASAQLAQSYIAPAYFLWIDVVGDPIRATNYGKPVTFVGTGDPDLDGKTFAVPTDKRLLSVGDISFTDAGSDTVSVFLSGIVTIDAALMAEIGDRSKWQGRTARLWAMIFDPVGAQQGGIAPMYTGYGSMVDIHPSPDGQTIELKLENYLALLSRASGRTLLNQADFDPVDTSAAATVSAANGITRGPGGGAAGVAGGTDLLGSPRLYSPQEVRA